MFGFIIGTVCLIALVKVLRRGRGWYGHRWGYGPHGGGYGHGYMGGGGARWFLRGLFHRLETTPGSHQAKPDQLAVAPADAQVKADGPRPKQVEDRQRQKRQPFRPEIDPLEHGPSLAPPALAPG